MAVFSYLGIGFDGTPTDLTPTISTTTNGRYLILLELARRLQIPRGWFPPAPKVGFDLRAELNESHRGTASLHIKQGVEEQALLDERITEADAQITIDETGERYEVLIRIESVDGSFAGLLTFVKDVIEVTVELLSEQP